VPRSTRYQGAIIRDHHILLIKQTGLASGRSYWLIPGGRIEPDETEEDCVRREMQEETGLHVQVQYLLLDEPSNPGASFRRQKTYVCRILDGEARPGYEPEEAYATAYRFTDIGWFELCVPRAGTSALCQIRSLTPYCNAFKLRLGTPHNPPL